MPLLPIENADTSRAPILLRSGYGWAANPVTIYLLVLVTVFTLDALETWTTPAFFPFLLHFPHKYYDPVLTTLFVAPVLWWLVFRPLYRDLVDATVRNEAVKSQVVDAIVTIDMQGVIISFNPAAERIFGYFPEEISGKKAAVLFCDSSLDAANLGVLADAKEVSIPLIHEVTCHRKDGHVLRLEISVSRLLVAGMPQFLVIMRDITKRLRMEREAREIQARLIQTNKMVSLGLMVSGVAHEVNNPNNYILSNAQLMERSCGDIIKVLREYQKENGEFLIGGLPFNEMEQHFPEMISGIIDGTQRINGIINELKTFARQGSEDNFEEMNLNLAVKAALMIIRNQVSKYTNNFTVHLDDNLPKIIGNSQQIGQVVINLLMNACQAVPDETSAISLLTWFDDASAEVVITIADEGGGIPVELTKRVLEPFFSTKTGSGGTGLGLSISNTIIKGHSGRLIFHSAPGTGTIFEARLPVVKQSGEDTQ
ncbi:MAG: PAS domain S-box protein [Geobacteraceae bacterium]|nr:PAS domain S-box protein [Geobacteraceae bacterium]